jgi:hypothetical protein
MYVSVIRVRVTGKRTRTNLAESLNSQIPQFFNLYLISNVSGGFKKISGKRDRRWIRVNRSCCEAVLIVVTTDKQTGFRISAGGFVNLVQRLCRPYIIFKDTLNKFGFRPEFKACDNSRRRNI